MTYSDSVPQPTSKQGKGDLPGQLRLFDPAGEAVVEIKVEPATPGTAFTKRCSRCGRMLPVEMFGTNNRRSTGLESHCKECGAESDRRRFAALSSREVIETPEEKRCPACGKVKAAKEFPTARGRRDGLGSECRECKSKKAAAYYQRNPPAIAARKAKRRTSGKSRSGSAARYAVTAGKAERQPCEVCGEVKSHAHHWSYKPEHALDVVWLCPRHHPVFGHGGSYSNPPLPKEETRRLIEQAATNTSPEGSTG